MQGVVAEPTSISIRWKANFVLALAVMCKHGRLRGLIDIAGHLNV